MTICRTNLKLGSTLARTIVWQLMVRLPTARLDTSSRYTIFDAMPLTISIWGWLDKNAFSYPLKKLAISSSDASVI